MYIILDLTSAQALALARALRRDVANQDVHRDNDPALIEVLEKLVQALKQTV